MAATNRLLDVLIVETNTVYRGVPFTVVTDWLQQGRLLPEDRARPAGAKTKWFQLGDIPAFAAYLPKPDPQRVEDRAEALEPVEGEFSWRGHHDEEDDDPDMIPLIDITLVLLIFFMMTASTQAGLFSPIDTPGARSQVATIAEGSYWVGVEKDRKDKQADALYSLGKDEAALVPPGPTTKAVLDRLRVDLDNVRGEVRVRLRGDKEIGVKAIRVVLGDLHKLERAINVQRTKAGLEGLTLKIDSEVSEPVD